MSDLIAHFNAHMDGRYRFESELGAGGMAKVFLAHDLRHDRKVAIKVMRPEVAQIVGAESFLNEIRVTANLQHPHILPLFDSGEAAGQLFFVMPFVAGETLKTRLEQEGRLDVAESVAIGRSVAAALHYAHSQDVVHLDVKPENVMLSAGLPLVSDFGIASALSAARNKEDVGVSMGTSGYASPEQAAGDPVDERSDVYGLGCLMYQMVTGEQPYKAPSARALLAKILTEPIPSPTDLRPDLPERVSGAIMRALATEPDERFATPAEMAVALVGGSHVPIAVREPLAIAPSQRTPFVSRDDEWGLLMEALDNAEQGQGSLVMIGGEPGVGKTRLAEQTLLEAQRRDILCFIGHAYEGQGTTPYGPFVETLEYAARAIPEDLFREALGDAAPEVARIMPKLRTLFPDIPPAIDLPVEQQRRYLFNSYREFVERGTQASPCVILLDDIHWADESSLLLLEHLAQHLPTQRALFIATYRDMESDMTPAFQRTLANLTRQRLARRISLLPMDQASVAELLVALGGEDPPEALVATIHRETEGNPFFVEEVFRDLIERDELFDEQGRWRADLSMEQLDVPEGVRLVVGRRLDRVGETVQEALTAGGVVGRAFGHDIMEALDIVSPDELLDALEEAEAAHLITSMPDGRGIRYRFSHELIRSTLVSQLAMPRRRQLHRRIARAMEEVHGSTLDERAADYSYHLYEAGSGVDEDALIKYLHIAARRAVDGVAFEEALFHADRALALGTPRSTDVQAELLYNKAQALRGSGDWAGAKRVLDEALPLFEELGKDEVVAPMCIAIAELCAWLDLFEEWRPTIVRGLESVGEEPSVARARLLAALASYDARLGDLDAGLALFDQAEDMAEALGDDEVVSYIQSQRTSVVIDHLLIHLTIDSGEECLDRLKGYGDYWALTYAQAAVQYGYLVSGRKEEVARLREDMLPVANSIGQYGALMLADFVHGHLEYTLAGDLDRMETWSASGVTKWAGVGNWAYYYAYWESIAHFWKGDWDEALRRIDVALEHFPEGWWIGRLRAWRIMLHAYAGTGQAPALFDAHRYAIPEPNQTAWGGNKAFALLAPDTLATMGETEEAARLYPVVQSIVDDGVIVWETGLAHRYLGISASCAEDWDVAEEHFREALSMAHGYPHRVDQPETRRWHAWMLQRRAAQGDASRARLLLEEAIALYLEIGMPRHAALTREMF